MTTSIQAKERPSITKAEIRQGIKKLLPFAVNKTGENLFETIVTIVVIGVTIAWLSVVASQPVTWSELNVYLITGFILYQCMRIVHDFDDHTSTDELSERLMETEQRVREIHFVVKNESSMPDDVFDQRLNNI